jgi:hypothetical protein
VAYSSLQATLTPAWSMLLGQKALEEHCRMLL